MKKTCLALLGAALLTWGCKKNNELSNFTGSYQPITKGSYWKYRHVTPSGVYSETTTMTGATKTINDRLYFEHNTVYQHGNSSTGYFFSKDGVVMSSTGNNESLFLKENAAIGETWIYMGPTNEQVIGGNITGFFTIVSELVEKGITYSVAGKAFKDVIHIKHSNHSSSGATIITYDYYIAKGIGMIERRSTDGNSILSLVEYSIK